MNIYCIIKESKDLKRILLSQKLQKELSKYLKASIEEIKKKEGVKFSGEYKPEENEVLLIENFSNPYASFDTLSLEKLAENEIESIKALVFSMDDGKIAYQCFDSRKIIRPEKWILINSEETYSKIDKKGLIIGNNVDAVFLNNSLFFNSYHNASKIFDLSEYYKEATDNEIENFMKDQIIEYESSFDKSLLNSRMRKKIYLILKNEVLSKVDENFGAVVEYSKQIGISTCFDQENKKIVFPNEKKEFEKLLNFLNDDIYNSPITGNNYETNSKRKISNQT